MIRLLAQGWMIVRDLVVLLSINRRLCPDHINLMLFLPSLVIIIIVGIAEKLPSSFGR